MFNLHFEINIDLEESFIYLEFSQGIKILFGEFSVCIDQFVIYVNRDQIKIDNLSINITFNILFIECTICVALINSNTIMFTGILLCK